MSDVYTRLLRWPVTLHLRTPGVEDEHGNPAIVEADQVVSGYASRQIGTENGQIMGEQFRLFLEASVPLTGWDAVTYENQRYEVIGAPWPVTNPRTGSAHHVEADIRRADT